MNSHHPSLAPQPKAIAYLMRRGVSAQGRGFLAALLDTLDGGLEPKARDELLQAIGARLAEATPLPSWKRTPTRRWP